MATSLLPQGSELFEVAFEQSAFPQWEALNEAADRIKSVKYAADRPASFLPFIVYEYGLHLLRPFVPNLESLIIEGVAWERVRGTPQAIELGLRWVGYTATILSHKPNRAYWNSFQLYFGSMPRYDAPDLSQIEGIVGLSVPARSKFRRGVFGYDATALVLDGGRLDDSLLDFESGVTFSKGNTLWSFGRLTEVPHTLTDVEGMAIGNWIDPAGDDSTPWVTMDYPWLTAEVQWSANAALQRAVIMAAFFRGKDTYMEFLDQAGGTIGFRRCKVSQVRSAPGGSYTFAGATYASSNSGDAVYFEARTDFADAEGVTASAVRLVLEPVLAAGIPVARLWLKAGDVVSGQRFAQKSISLDMRKTVRQQVKTLLRF